MFHVVVRGMHVKDGKEVNTQVNGIVMVIYYKCGWYIDFSNRFTASRKKIEVNRYDNIVEKYR